MKRLLLLVMLVASAHSAFGQIKIKVQQAEPEINSVERIAGGKIVRNRQKEAEINQYNNSYTITFLGTGSTWFSISFENKKELDSLMAAVLNQFGQTQIVNVRTDKKKGNIDIRHNGNTAQVSVNTPTGRYYLSKPFTKEEAQQLFVY